MKRFRHYAGLWGILTSSFIIFTAASSFDSISIGRHELKSSGLSQAIFGKAQTEDVQSAPVFENDTVSIIQSCNPEPVPVDTAAQTILIIGDSMLEGLVPRLAAYSDHNGHKLYAAMWYSSTSAVWGRSRKLQRYIERLHPTFIIVSLGANELFVTDIRRKRERYVRNILDLRTGKRTQASTPFCATLLPTDASFSATECNSDVQRTAHIPPANRLPNGSTA